MPIASTVSTPSPAGPFAGKVSTDRWYPVLLVDATDGITPETGIGSAAIDVDYALLDGSTTLTNYTVGGSDWFEVNEGLYALRIGAGEFTAAGTYVVRVADTTPNGRRYIFFVEVTAAGLDDLVRATTPANTLDVDANGDVNVAAIAAGAVTATAIASDAITAAKIAADAIGSDELAATAVAKIADAIWDEATSGHVTGGTFGAQAKTVLDAVLADTAEVQAGLASKYTLLDHLDADITSRSDPATAQVIDLTTSLPGSPTAGTVGEALKFADTRLDAAMTTRAAAADWTTARSEKIDNLDATVSSRSAPATAQTIDMTQATPDEISGNNVGSALSAAKAGVVHRRKVEAGVLTYYKADQTSPLATLTKTDTQLDPL